MGLFNFNRLIRAENKIINKADKSFTKRQTKYTPNRNIGGRVTTEEFEDDYTRKTRAEKLQASSDYKTGYFIDANGNKTPIEQLNGQTERLLKEARESLARELDSNQSPAEEEDDNQTPEAAKNELKEEKFKNWHPNLKSIEKFYSQSHIHYDNETDKTKTGNIGLYKHNPKLNPGAPESRKERRRQSKKTKEENKWQPVDSEPDWPDLPDISEDE